MQIVLWWVFGLFSAMIEMTCPFNHFFDLWQWCNFSGIKALEFSCLYTRIQPATADVFPVIANTRTKSIQKQVKSIDVNKVGSKKHLASKSILFRVELIASSFLDLIFKQARLNAAVSGFLFLLILSNLRWGRIQMVLGVLSNVPQLV